MKKGFLFILPVICFFSCKHYIEVPDPEPEGCDPEIVYFERDILPIFQSNCAKSGCHGNGSAQDGVTLDNYDDIIRTGDIEAYEPEDSEVYEKITENDPDKRMPPPPNTPLSDQQIAMIRKWIEQGAKNLKCDDGPCDTTSVTYSGSIQPITQKHCQGCHSGTSPAGGYDFTTHAGLETVVLNDRLLGAITHADNFKPMPQGGKKLSDCNIAKIRIWIDNGAPDN